ncbi:hypothetical protein HDV64DRAFT_291080 [Trichoderma sp. TUCIM 5745]
MAASMKLQWSGHGPGSSPSGRRVPDFPWMSKEPGLDDKLQHVLGPGSPKATEAGHSRFWTQSSFDHRDLSEETLAEGFKFQPREKPRPGQYSDIPRRATPATPAATLLSESLERKFTSPPKDKFTIPLPRASPLDLPELCLPSKPTDMSSGIPEMPEQPVLHTFSIHSGLSNVKELASPRSVSPKSAIETNDGAKLLSPPKHTASPELGRYQKYPSAAEHKMVLPTGNNTHLPSQRHVQTNSTGRNEQRHSPPSICGDLEVPTYRSYTKPQNHRYKDSLARPMPCASTKGRKQPPLASSNISKMRKARKEETLNHMSDYLNQFIAYNENELKMARSDLRRLSGDVQHQESELEKSRALLVEKDVKLSETEKLYKALLEEDTRNLEDKKSLNSELDTLRQQLSEEKKRSELLKEKHQESRSRLNDAIKEQQNLFSRSRDLCKETMDQLRKDKAAKTSASDAVEKALEVSQKKREEMKKCLEEYRLQADKDVQQKDQIIAILKEKLGHQEKLLAQEKLLDDALHAQTEEMRVARECIRTLEAKVEALMAHHTTQNEQRQLDTQQSTEMMDMLNKKLDTLINGGNFVVGNMLSRDDLAVELEAVEKSIVESFSPVVFSLESAQRDSSNVITQLESSVRQNLDEFRNEALQFAGRWEEKKQDNGTQIQDLLKHIQELGGGLKKTENICEHIGQRFDALVDTEQSQQHTTDAHIQGLTQRFLDRETKLDHMESRLEQMHQGFTTKIDTIISGALNTDKEATKLIRSAAAELRDVLERGFGQEKERISHLLAESENIAKAIAAHVAEQKESATTNHHKSDELQASLDIERGTIAQLTCKLQQFEHQVQENEGLHERWLKEIQDVEAVRAQLKAIQEQNSPAKDCEKKIDRLVEISEFIQSSTSYLATESEWIQQELAARAPEPTVEVDNNSSAFATGSSEAVENHPPAKDDGAFRKVTVHSPDPGESSPSPPPTVMQEQMRRRATTQLRSILKGQIQSSTPQVDQSKPLDLSTGSLGKAGSSSKQMVAEICSRMVRHDWSFPTVADFERDIQLASKKRESPQDNPITSQLDNPSSRDAKKSRILSYIGE